MSSQLQLPTTRLLCPFNTNPKLKTIMVVIAKLKAAFTPVNWPNLEG